MRFVLTVLAVVVLSSTLQAQNLPGNWKDQLNKSLEEFLQCTSSSDKSSCNKFTGDVLNKIYKVNDFYSAQEKRYMTPGEIALAIKSNKHWQALGQSYDQKTLDEAQQQANARKPVLAVYMNAQGVGHVALIIPGEQKMSGSWGLSVPAAASFLATDPSKSFVDKGLSFAFTKSMLKDVMIYSRAN